MGDSSAAVFYAVLQSNVYYLAGSLLEAVELCLKATFVFHLGYPVAAQSSWLFLQQAVLQIFTPQDGKNSRVTSLMSDLQSA